jgi:hypothetical protein
LLTHVDYGEVFDRVPIQMHQEACVFDRHRAAQAADLHGDALRSSGYIAMSGQIVDASLISAPKQRNTREENQTIKAGGIPEDWAKKPAKVLHTRRALDGQVHQGQDARGRDYAAGRHRHPDLRLSEPCVDRSRLWPDPQMAGDRRRIL